MDKDRKHPATLLRLVVDNGQTPVRQPEAALHSRMRAIADTIGVPVSTFFEDASLRLRDDGPEPDGPPTRLERVELNALFGQLHSREARRDCLNFLRSLTLLAQR